MKGFDETEWAKRKSLLREHFSGRRLDHADYAQSRVLEKSKRARKGAASGMLPLPWLVWSGVFALFVAALLTSVVLPQQPGWLSNAEFFSEVVSARAELPQLSVSHFSASDQRGIVIWIEGAEYIAPQATVR
jgi:hypothetical protein